MIALEVVGINVHGGGFVMVGDGMKSKDLQRNSGTPLRLVQKKTNISDKFVPLEKGWKVTDLLVGIASPIPNSNKHFFLADFDHESPEEIMGLVGKILFDKHKFGNCYLIKSGKGYHVISFSKKLTINKYANILEEMDADPKYIEWIRHVKYGVLRMGRRSSHKKVPKLIAILKSPYHKQEDVFIRNYYFNLLSLEDNIYDIIRCKVFDYDKKD